MDSLEGKSEPETIDFPMKIWVCPVFFPLKHTHWNHHENHQVTIKSLVSYGFPHGFPMFSPCFSPWNPYVITKIPKDLPRTPWTEVTWSNEQSWWNDSSWSLGRCGVHGLMSYSWYFLVVYIWYTHINIYIYIYTTYTYDIYLIYVYIYICKYDFIYPINTPLNIPTKCWSHLP